MIDRRRALALFAVLALGAGGGCKREARCQNCGMRIDPASPWRADVVGQSGAATSFDSPRCALVALRSGKVRGTLRVQEYYERRWRDASELRFVVGGDVLGPMGPDLVPVDPARQTKFLQDHGADRALELSGVTPETLSGL
jgi:hypothetical protein